MLLLILIGVVSTANCFDYSKRCLLHRGECVAHCPRGMHPYDTRCHRDTVSQRTCDQPTAYDIGYTCGWSRCDCNGEFLLDESTGVCVDPKSCPAASDEYRKRKDRREARRRKLESKNRMIDDESDVYDID